MNFRYLSANYNAANPCSAHAWCWRCPDSSGPPDLTAKPQAFSSSALHLSAKASCLTRLSTTAAAGGNGHKMPLCLKEHSSRMGSVQALREDVASFQGAASKGVKSPMEDYGRPSPLLPPLPQGFPVCISHGRAPAPELPAVLETEGMLTSSAKGIMSFLKGLWLPWAHTHWRGRLCRNHQPGWLGFQQCGGGSSHSSPLRR